MWKTTLRLSIILLFSVPHLAYGQTSPATITDFVLAMEAVKQPDKTPEDVAAYLAFMTDDVSDIHVAYNVSFEGKQKLRQNLLESTRKIFNASLELEGITLGSGVAIVQLTESSKYVRRNELVDFSGRTILVLELTEDGHISQMRRYLDTASVIRNAVPCGEGNC